MGEGVPDVQPLGPRWAEARFRAAQFAAKWAGERREKAEKDTFWNELLAALGIDRRQVARFEAAATRYSTGRSGFIDVFWPGRLLVEHKSAGEDLSAAMVQALDYLPDMEPADVPRLLVVCDFGNFVVRDLTTGQQSQFTLADLPTRIDAFAAIFGREVHDVSEEDVNLEAAQLVTDFGDALSDLGYGDHHRRILLARVLFCLFADDAAVWPTGLFEDFIRLRTRKDGRDLGPQLAYLFQLLDDPSRPDYLDGEVRDFVYVNGGLFHEPIPIAVCDARMRQSLLEACRFNWSRISPAIFGSMFQNALTPAGRRSLGAHYTTEQNILRTIRPLFLKDLEAQLAACGDDLRKMREFRDKLGRLTFFDPACGCGNFLVITYREIRRIELDCLVRIREVEGRTLRRSARPGGEDQIALDVTWESVVHVGQFYGIEIEEWPCRIASTAMHLTDHLANQELSVALGAYYARFPISDDAHIHNDNALRRDWNEVLPAERCDYLFGNPPFAGQKTRAAEQTADMNLVWGRGFSRYLDYVSGWYRLAANYLNRGRQCAAAFVSTNSVTQGEQVARLWRTLLDSNIKIDFGHRTFAWTSEARNRAQVHVVIVGFSHQDRQPKRRVIFNYDTPRSEPVESVVSHINPYLLPLPDVLVESRPERPLSPALPPVAYGNKPSDGGHLIVELGALPPQGDPAWSYIRRYVGARELTHGEERYCVWMDGPDADAVRRSAWLRRRLEAVREFRLASEAADTRKTADVPWRFFRTPQPSTPFIAIPRHVTGMREWFTVALLEPDFIASDALFTAVDIDGFAFGILSSAMFGAWMRTVGGAIKSDPRFSGPMVYNTFPLPMPNPETRERVIDAGQNVSNARANHPEIPLEALYERLAVPSDVLAAHRVLDRAVDSLFATRRRYETTPDRMAVLFDAYEDAIGHLGRAARVPRRRRTARPI